ncbi:MAG: protein translocase subunit SecF [Candidatus Buchananbacteria bacterium]|nr:protein translocase subunit SecF [Candidatus Buchananbacteria bacterium]
MKLQIVKNRKYNYIFSVVLFVVSVVALVTWGLKPGLDFTGGSLMELSFEPNRPESAQIEEIARAQGIEDVRVQQAGERDSLLRFKHIDEAQHQQLIKAYSDQLAPSTTVKELRFEAVGPAIGQELAQKAWQAIAVTVLAIVAYIAFAFRKVSKPVESWKFGVAAIIALVHDITIVAGLFSILGHFYGTEVDGLFITALLTILGFSVHDTIVVFDRTRENLSRHHGGGFEEVVNDSINQTLARSINTSVTTLIVLTSLFIFGGETIHDFVLALIVGIAIGTYSSIFVASPLVVDWFNFDRRRKGAR